MKTFKGNIFTGKLHPHQQVIFGGTSKERIERIINLVLINNNTDYYIPYTADQTVPYSTVQEIAAIYAAIPKIPENLYFEESFAQLIYQAKNNPLIQ